LILAKSNIKKEDVEIILRKMLKEGKMITLVLVCKYMKIDPFVVIRDENGNYLDYIDNQAAIYKYIRELHEEYIDWHAERKEACEKYKEGWKKVSNWDSKLGKMIYDKDIMSFDQFIDRRIRKRGLNLISMSKNSEISNIYIVPTPEEEKRWIEKTASGGIKHAKTSIARGIRAGVIEDNRKTRKLLDKLDPKKYLKYKEVEEDEEEYEEEE